MSKPEKSEFLSRRVRYIKTGDIRPNAQQPRREFDPQAIEELARSIRAYGILQPLTVRRREGYYELVAGERRLRAAVMAGLGQVPCLVARVDETDAGLLALIENLQRRDLSYMEEARAIAGLITRHGLTQAQIAQKLGRSQSTVANKLRLLRLPEEVLQVLERAGLTERHARALLSLSDPREQLLAAETMARRHLTVAEAEAYVQGRLHTLQKTPPARRSAYILKDVRLFLNSVQRQVQLIRQNGVAAELTRQEAEDAVILTIRVPTRREKVHAEK